MRNMLLAASALAFLPYGTWAQQAPTSDIAPQTTLTAADPTTAPSDPTAAPATDTLGTITPPASSSAVPLTMTTTSGANGPACQVPAPASAVGYNQLTYGPDMVLGANWVPGDNVTSGVTQNPDGSITIDGGTGNHYNDQIGTGSALFGGGGYFQATLSFKNPPAGWSSGADGWPAFWGVNPNPGDKPHIEPDFFEFMQSGVSNVFDYSLQDWHADGSRNGPGTPVFDSNNMPGGTHITLPANFDPSQPHTYGWLWVPATDSSQGYAKMFVDGQQVGPTPTWSPGGPFSNLDDPSLPLQIMLGTGSANPMTVYNTQIWQKDTSGDVGVAGTSTGNTGGACPTTVTADGSGSGSGPTGGANGAQGDGTTDTTGIAPQTNLQHAMNMTSPSGSDRWGTFSVGGTDYQVTIVGPPGDGPSYEVLIANNGTPYIFALPAGVGGGDTTLANAPGTLPGGVTNTGGTAPSSSPSSDMTTMNTPSGSSGGGHHRSSQNGGSPNSPTTPPQSGDTGSTTAPQDSGTTPTVPATQNSGSGGGEVSGVSQGGGGTDSWTPLPTDGNLQDVANAMQTTAQNSGEYGGNTITLQPGDITPVNPGSVTDSNGTVWSMIPMDGQFAGAPMGIVTRNGEPYQADGGGGWVAALRVTPSGTVAWENAKGVGWFGENNYYGANPPA